MLGLDFQLQRVREAKEEVYWSYRRRSRCSVRSVLSYDIAESIAAMAM